MLTSSRPGLHTKKGLYFNPNIHIYCLNIQKKLTKDGVLCRKRAPKNAKRPNFRSARMMGAIERAMRTASTRKTEHIFEPILGMVFDSKQEAHEFYNMYSWEKGFGIKYNTSRPGSISRKRKEIGEDGEEYRSMQEIVCQKNVSVRTIYISELYERDKV